MVASKSKAAGALCSWVRAIDTFAKVSKEVEPKRNKMREAMRELKGK